MKTKNALTVRPESGLSELKRAESLVRLTQSVLGAPAPARNYTNEHGRKQRRWVERLYTEFTDQWTFAIEHAARLFMAENAAETIADIIGTPSANAEESCKTAALLIANACIVHKWLDETGNLGDLAKIETAHNAGNPPDALYRAWVTILRKGYQPVFLDAAALLLKLPRTGRNNEAIGELMQCAIDNATTLNELGFDHATSPPSRKTPARPLYQIV